ncbi:MAG: adenylosuccinate synthase [Verrucomicrobiota bacterium]
MANIVLIGGQWGDEGKGKIIDVLTEDSDVVVRYQGGNNAGHTVKADQRTQILHLVPSGILHAGKICVIGNGVVVDPLALLSEIKGLQDIGIKFEGRFFISDRAHVVFPYHRELDAARENYREDKDRIGTTKRGIGPTYGEKVSRRGLRMIDLIDSDFPAMARERIEEGNTLIEALGGKPVDVDGTISRYLDAAAALSPYVADSFTLLDDCARKGRNILFEGAQGTMLDIDFGTYPYVTSSNATSGGACTGAGFAPHRIDEVFGVIKAYTTRVGEGPFPTELTDDTGKALREKGAEFGATTGRPRRCGWFDAVVARYSAMVNGVDMWAVTKLDVLDGLEKIMICTGYECAGEKFSTIPANARMLANCKPVLEEMEGWSESTSGVQEYDKLPRQARNYVARISELTGTPVKLISTGPGRESTISLSIG